MSDLCDFTVKDDNGGGLGAERCEYCQHEVEESCGHSKCPNCGNCRSCGD